MTFSGSCRQVFSLCLPSGRVDGAFWGSSKKSTSPIGKVWRLHPHGLLTSGSALVLIMSPQQFYRVSLGGGCKHLTHSRCERHFTTGLGGLRPAPPITLPCKVPREDMKTTPHIEDPFPTGSSSMLGFWQRLPGPLTSIRGVLLSVGYPLHGVPSAREVPTFISRIASFCPVPSCPALTYPV